MNVTGHFVIDNTDPKGSITIKSAGYLNLVCGQERVDIVGKYIPTPSALALGTFTTQVFIPTPPSPMNRSVFGDYIFNSQGGASYTYALTNQNSMVAPSFGLNTIEPPAMPTELLWLVTISTQLQLATRHVKLAQVTEHDLLEATKLSPSLVFKKSQQQ